MPRFFGRKESKEAQIRLGSWRRYFTKNLSTAVPQQFGVSVNEGVRSRNERSANAADGTQYGAGHGDSLQQAMFDTISSRDMTKPNDPFDIIAGTVVTHKLERIRVVDKSSPRLKINRTRPTGSAQLYVIQRCERLKMHWENGAERKSCDVR